MQLNVLETFLFYIENQVNFLELCRLCRQQYNDYYNKTFQTNIMCTEFDKLTDWMSERKRVQASTQKMSPSESKFNII